MGGPVARERSSGGALVAGRWRSGGRPEKKGTQGVERRAAGSGGRGQGGGRGLQVAVGRAAGSAGRWRPVGKRRPGSGKARELGAWRCSGARLGGGARLGSARGTGICTAGGGRRSGVVWLVGAGDWAGGNRRNNSGGRRRMEGPLAGTRLFLPVLVTGLVEFVRVPTSTLNHDKKM
ncbi:uncharacterized protein LOC131876265 [Cryptomeria japonica]|uniref:uncharacterized protein LOC131876265 n=1 Tax=Cryptomeria japonica TaxID=3369 RepID=UPI0027DA7EBD|nr:uncharacterized protein LOC131876265 [Cryptomeria japonica]